MEFKIARATKAHLRYFKQNILENGIGYIVYNDSQSIGFFSFTLIDEKTASLDFPFCVYKQAIKLALDTFLEDYQELFTKDAIEKINEFLKEKKENIRGKNNGIK